MLGWPVKYRTRFSALVPLPDARIAMRFIDQSLMADSSANVIIVRNEF